MKRRLNKQQRQYLRKLGIDGVLYNVSSIDSLISKLPIEMRNTEGEIFRLSIRNLGLKWNVSYVNFENNEKLLGYNWYSSQLVDVLYKAVKNCAILNRQSLLYQ